MAIPEHETDATSLSLLNRVRASDDGAWERLMSLYGPLVRAWCRRAELDAVETDDVVQETFLAVSRGMTSFERGDDGTFRGWLRIIARNKIRDHFRRAGRGERAAGGSAAQHRLEQEPALPSESPDDAELSEERRIVHARALELIRTEFERNTWRAFEMTAVDGRTAVDVAADLGMTPGAVRQAKYKILRRLRAELGELTDGE